MTSASFSVNGWDIWYEKYGTGPKPLILIPGAIGSGQTDFYDQLYGEYALDMEKFTIIAIELPGWGRSRPPARRYGNDVFINDSDCIVQLMQSLGYQRFSVLGWSEGAKVALVLSAYYPDSVEDLILLGIIAFPTEINTRNILMTKNVSNWEQTMIDNYLRCYKDVKEIQELWTRQIRFISNSATYFPNGICHKKYDSIKCRTLIIHGDRDPLVQTEQWKHVLENVKGAQIKRFPLGSHNLHHKYQSEFKEITEEFLLKNDSYF